MILSLHSLPRANGDDLIAELIRRGNMAFEDPIPGGRGIIMFLPPYRRPLNHLEMIGLTSPRVVQMLMLRSSNKGIYFVGGSIMADKFITAELLLETGLLTRPDYMLYDNYLFNITRQFGEALTPDASIFADYSPDSIRAEVAQFGTDEEKEFLTPNILCRMRKKFLDNISYLSPANFILPEGYSVETMAEVIEYTARRMA